MSGGAALGPDALVAWLRRRRPAPPPDLQERLEEELRSVGGGESESQSGAAPERARPVAGSEGELEHSAGRSGALLALAWRRLDAAAARPGRVRDTAFELLVADTLVTYACEAALEEERPDEALRRILGIGRTR